MLSNTIVKSMAILCDTAIWLYAMWLYANTELNGWEMGSIFIMALLGTTGIAMLASIVVNRDDG